jgi:hypothetical protein
LHYGTIDLLVELEAVDFGDFEVDLVLVLD